MKKFLSVFICLVLFSSITGAAAYKDFGYDYIDEFSEGLAAARQDNRWGFINEKGETVIPFMYSEVSGFKEGMAVVRKGRFYGYINQDGKEVIPVQYISAESFSEGLAVVTNDGKMGAIDRTGKTVIPFEYDYMESFSEGYAVIAKGGEYNFIKANGSSLYIFNRLTFARSFESGVAYVEDNTGSKYYIHKDGSYAFQADNVSTFSEGFAIATRGNSFYILSENGVNPTGTTYELAEETGKGYILLYSNLHKGFFDKSTKTVTLSLDFELLSPPSDGLLLAIKDSRYGYVDSKLTKVIDFKYSYAESFSEGLAVVCKNDMYGFIDRTGKIVIPCEYEEACAFNEGLSIVRVGRYFGCIDKNGKLVVPAEYSYIKGFNNGISVAKKGGRYIIIDNPLTAGKNAAAVPTTAEIMIDGEKTIFEAYAIGGSNYFRLKDIAFSLNGTAKSFNIQYNEALNRTTITEKTKYVADGSEMILSGYFQPRNAVQTDTDLYIGTKKLEFAAYSIGGFNYYKLRDIASAINFSVGWDKLKKIIYIDTTKGYV